MNSKKLFVDKELSWLSFNHRVLQEAQDPLNPIIERIRFLGIYSNNLDEFYKVRFADVKRLILISKDQVQNHNAKELLNNIQKKINELNIEFNKTRQQVFKELAKRNIFLVNELQLDNSDKAYLKNYFNQNILPFISPIVLNDNIELINFLKDEYSYLFVDINSENQRNFALIEIPSEQIPRFIQIPCKKGSRKKKIIFLDDIIRLCLDNIFSGLFDYEQLNAYSMKMTRDAEYDLSTEIDFSILEQMSQGLTQRVTAKPVQFIYEENMPKKIVLLLCQLLKVSNYDSIEPGGRYHNYKDFLSFPNVGRDYLENKPIPPLETKDFTQFKNTFEAIRNKDILLYYPYHSFRHMTEFVRQAAFDPKVRAIKINIYRVAKNSKIIESMIDAANNGKKVTVVVELQARFDEEANIEWSKTLTESGVDVMFGVPGLKIHSKLCLVSRKEGDQLIRYAHIGTGNFHEKTARIYTDFSLFTCDKIITNEVKQVFDYIRNPYKPNKFDHLIVSPRNSRGKLYALIEREITNIKQGLKAGITLKVNNLVDQGLINKLYEASNSGVKINIIVRGMCSLIPNLAGYSENIEIISIVDRFLEHPRVVVFNNNNNPSVFISSADWMSRNIDNRIEVGCPVRSSELKEKIIRILNIQLQDKVKARIVDENMTNTYIPRGNKKKLRSQIEIYKYLKSLEK
ncbi:polyphosphate kinase 1 [Paraphotobacterium marinum]|uniref:polyphosphate kinase 1 n=1 Tax=Paraphotobacterium marinum TaxID=1755811 RepID=UPI0039E8E47C